MAEPTTQVQERAPATPLHRRGIPAFRRGTPFLLFRHPALLAAVALGSLLLALAAAAYPLFMAATTSNLVRAALDRPSITRYGAGLSYTFADAPLERVQLFDVPPWVNRDERIPGPPVHAGDGRTDRSVPPARGGESDPRATRRGDPGERSRRLHRRRRAAGWPSVRLDRGPGSRGAPCRHRGRRRLDRRPHRRTARRRARRHDPAPGSGGRHRRPGARRRDLSSDLQHPAGRLLAPLDSSSSACPTVRTVDRYHNRSWPIATSCWAWSVSSASRRRPFDGWRRWPSIRSAWTRRARSSSTNAASWSRSASPTGVTGRPSSAASDSSTGRSGPGSAPPRRRSPPRSASSSTRRRNASWRWRDRRACSRLRGSRSRSSS